MDTLIGSTLDKYEVLQKVGEGGMATVYRGRHTTLNRDVAIKVLHPHLSSSARNRKRFAREARAIEHLRHANILQIFDYSGLDADDCYIITEFIEGETISTVLKRRGSFPSEVTAIIGLRLAGALAYAHGEGILHRDLKPDNVMLRFDGTIKLMDFGIARFLDESQVTMTGALVGSPAFMSPEQAREQPLDLRSDLFSLGTMLFFLVTGHLPFNGSNPSLILKNVIEGNRPSVAELAPTMSANLADVIERLMATHPNDRFEDALEVQRALEGALAEANVDADDPRWSLAGWLEDAEGFEGRLGNHLREVLLVRGRQHLVAGDHLAALRLFNRLLSMDEDNPQVLALVQGLHGEVRRRPSASILGLLAVAGMVALGGAGLLWWSWDTPGTGSEALAATRLDPGFVVPTVPPRPPDAPSGQEARTEAQAVSPGDAASTSPAPPTPAARLSPASEPREAARAIAAPRPSRPSNRPPSRVLAPPPATNPPPPDPPAEILVRSTNATWGDIFIDDQRRGQTRDLDPILVPPGSYEIVVKSAFVKPVTLRVDVEPGERFERLIDLELLPGEVEFREADYPTHCGVLLDGRMVGTVGQLDRVLRVSRPDIPHEVTVDCSGNVTRKAYAHVPQRTPFPAP